jgi:hypothetical protein
MGLSSFQLTALDYQRLTDWKARIIAKLAAKYRALAFFVNERGFNPAFNPLRWVRTGSVRP